MMQPQMEVQSVPQVSEFGKDTDQKGADKFEDGEKNATNGAQVKEN